MPRVDRFVALGDSQTEGLHDYHPDGGPRGWADRFAETVAKHHPDVHYANLAVRGKRTAEIRRTQLEPALALEPDLASVMSGVNDVIRPGADVDAVAADLEAMYAALVGIGCRVIVCTFPLPSTGLTARVAPRLQALNARIREAASRHGVLVAELEPFPMAADLRLWAGDRIHLNPDGHARLAAAMFSAFAQDGDTSWQKELPDAPARGRLGAAASEAAWIASYVVPKIGRMIRGVSSGDGREAKRPGLERVRRDGGA
ncbi:MAG: SGNH/GDSL hydrolase family protein [bacterium]|nr:SGNH/GDSL hydrolase family protein [bacterium]